MPLLLRRLAKDDYAVIDGGDQVGRIRRAAERKGEVWMWNVTVNLSGGVPSGTAESLEQAKADFRGAWLAFKPAQ